MTKDNNNASYQHNSRAGEIVSYSGKFHHMGVFHLWRYGLLAGLSCIVMTDSLQATEQKADDPGKEELTLEEVVVTGSHIRGVGVSVGSRVNIIDRAEIARSGFATTQQVIQSLPQNFGGGPNEDTLSTGNVTGGSGINLRGLGADATLVLVNGRRIPVAGLGGDFFDVSMVPATAIERIEVLPDGASAIYGADAVAGVVNIILAKDFDGAETHARVGTVTDGGLQEYQLGQSYGKNWESGNILFSYEYYKRERLQQKSRTFAADSDLRALGGDNFSDNFSNPGNIMDPATGFATVAFAIPKGQDGTSLVAGDLLPGAVNLRNKQRGRDILPDQQRHSFFVSARQDMNDRITVFSEGKYSERDFDQVTGARVTPLLVPASNPFFVDAFGGFPFVIVNYDLSKDLGLSSLNGKTKKYNGLLGIDAELGGDWRLEAYGSYSREDGTSRTNGFNPAALNAALADPDPLTAFNPFGDGSFTNPATLDSIRIFESFATLSELWSANAVADGSLFRLPGGDVKLAVGLNYRAETFGKSLHFATLDSQTQFDRKVLSAFGELYVPLIGEGNRRTGFNQLALSIAGRYERYRGISRETTTNPKFGLIWSPVEGVKIRGSFGTSFRAPNLPDLDESTNATFLIPVTDPISPTGSTFSLLRFGGNAKLRNETATSWTVGVDYTPERVPDFNIGLTYFNIAFRDRILAPQNALDVLTQETRNAGIIIRNPSSAQINALCQAAQFEGDPASCGLLPIGAIIDGRMNNRARTKVDGLDLTVSYGMDTVRAGRFNFQLNANYLLHFKDALSRASAFTDIVDTIHNPVDFRLRASLSWQNDRGVSATVFANYTDSYRDNVSQPERRINSWTTIDATLTYNLEDNSSLKALQGVILSLSVQNIFDTDPPFVNNALESLGYDPANADPLGRFISFNITKKW